LKKSRKNKNTGKVPRRPAESFAYGTNVAPLSVTELRRIYSYPDELAGVTAQKLAAFQSQVVVLDKDSWQ
jgi:hypothetical protein